MKAFLRRWFGPDREHAHVGRTFSDRVLIQRMAVGVVGSALGFGGLALLGQTDWREVLAGALLAWAVAVIVWAIASRHDKLESIRRELRRTAELDVIHARLNQVAARVGARPLGLQGEIEHITDFRMRRLAHFAALDEFIEGSHGEHADQQAYEFWDLEALGGEM